MIASGKLRPSLCLDGMQVYLRDANKVCRCRCKAEWCYKCGKLTRGAPKTIEMRFENGVEQGDAKYEGLCMCHAKLQVNLIDDGDELPELNELLGLGDTSRSRMRSEGRLLEGVNEEATEVIEID